MTLVVPSATVSAGIDHEVVPTASPDWPLSVDHLTRAMPPLSDATPVSATFDDDVVYVGGHGPVNGDVIVRLIIGATCPPPAGGVCLEHGNQAG